MKKTYDSNQRFKDWIKFLASDEAMIYAQGKLRQCIKLKELDGTKKISEAQMINRLAESYIRKKELKIKKKLKKVKNGMG